MLPCVSDASTASAEEIRYLLRRLLPQGDSGVGVGQGCDRGCVDGPAELGYTIQLSWYRDMRKEKR